MEIKLLFLHQKKFILFLAEQIKQFRQPPGLHKAFISISGQKGGSKNAPKLLNPDRPVLSIDEFDDEYRVFMKANKQNLKALQELENDDTETAQEQVLQQQLTMQDDKHFYDTYMSTHVIKSKIE